MAVIYLKHPQHGAKVAISDAEAENDIENGWQRFDPENAPAQTEEPQADVLANTLEQPKRRGRPPRQEIAA